MAIALVKLGVVSSGTTSVSPAFGQATGAGNLLVAWVTTPQNPASTLDTPAGWTRVCDDESNTGGAIVYYKANSAAGETAPTFNCPLATAVFAVLGEFSGASTTSPVDQHSGRQAAVSPTVVANATNDGQTGDLVITCMLAVYSMGASKTTSDTYNNGATPAGLNNDGTNTANHYRFSWGITSSQSGPTQDSFAYTITNVVSAGGQLVTFKIPGSTTPKFIGPIVVDQGGI